MYKISPEYSMYKASLWLIENGQVNDVKILSLSKIVEGLGLAPVDFLNET